MWRSYCADPSNPNYVYFTWVSKTEIRVGKADVKAAKFVSFSKPFEVDEREPVFWEYDVSSDKVFVSYPIYNINMFSYSAEKPHKIDFDVEKNALLKYGWNYKVLIKEGKAIIVHNNTDTNRIEVFTSK